MHLKVKINCEEADHVLRRLIKYELSIAKAIMTNGSEAQKKFYDAYTPELVAALNTVLTHFSVPKKKKSKKFDK